MNKFTHPNVLQDSQVFIKFIHIAKFNYMFFKFFKYRMLVEPVIQEVDQMAIQVITHFIVILTVCQISGLEGSLYLLYQSL